MHLGSRVKRPVYWTGADLEVRRASWFHRSAAEGRWAQEASFRESFNLLAVPWNCSRTKNLPSCCSRWLPYEEEVADKLEQEYQGAVATGQWQCKVVS